MVVGFNHNFTYKGQVYHVQTEDSGVKNPHIITLLYRGGTILSSKRTSYADIIKVDHLEAVVEELMKTQHREMLRRLKNGDLDGLLGLTTAAPPTAAPVRAPLPAEKSPPALPNVVPLTPPPSLPPVAPLLSRHDMRPEKKERPNAPTPEELTLDDIILSYMVGEEQKK